MNNFTEQYIKECDCKEIQGLRRFLKEGDKISSKTDYSFRDTLQEEVMNISNPVIIWLPTGDQLDDEIVKIKSDIEYHIQCKGNWWKVWAFTEGATTHNIHYGDNPLIAKIKLLKALLKEK